MGKGTNFPLQMKALCKAEQGIAPDIWCPHIHTHTHTHTHMTDGNAKLETELTVTSKWRFMVRGHSLSYYLSGCFLHIALTSSVLFRKTAVPRIQI